MEPNKNEKKQPKEVDDKKENDEQKEEKPKKQKSKEKIKKVNEQDDKIENEQDDKKENETKENEQDDKKEKETKENEQDDEKEKENKVPEIHVKSVNELEKLIDYKYNENGELLHKKTGKKCDRLGQQEYELVGMYVQKYVENLLIQTFDLITLYVPNKTSTDFSVRDESQAQCKIAITKDFPTNPKCLMLIQGTGAVRLGQWARSVCINDNLRLGTMLPYLEKAIKNNFSVIIFNPNEKYDFKNDKKQIKEFNTMEKHSVYVYNNIVKKNKNIKEIYIVAHSRGGDCAVEILLENKEDLLGGKIKKIAFTDSVHGDEYLDLKKEGVEKFREISRNYITSDKPLGTFVKGYKKAYGGVDCYSSGHEKHEYTSGTAIEEVFKFFGVEN